MVVVSEPQEQDETIVKDARSKLSDVLANIRSGKIEEEYDYDEGDDNDQDFPPPPQKRRHTANYVTMSGIQRRTRSTEESAASKSFSVAPASAPQSTPAKPSTFVLKLFDRTVDLAQFSHADANEDAPLYPVCRAWVHSQQANLDTRTSRNKLLVYPPNQEGNQDAGGVHTIYRLPKPMDNKTVLRLLNIEEPSDTDPEQINLRIPASVRNWKCDPKARENIDKVIDSRPSSNWSHEERLEENCRRWRQIRDEWQAAAKLNESRYSKCSTILRDIYLTNTVKQTDMQ